MQFKHPELLYALFLLLIPIIVHLFQLRKFKKEQFTNVAFLKEVVLQTRKSSQLKKWLTLITRLLLLAAIILAFAQPYTSKNKTFNSVSETVIYLDNSFSMQAKGNQGELLKRAIQDIISQVDENEKISLFTNDELYRNTSLKAIKNELLQLSYSSNQLHYDAALLKAKKLFSKNSSNIKNVVFISDFQQKNNPFSPVADSLIQINAVSLNPINTQNTLVDSIYVSKQTSVLTELTVVIKNNGETIDNLPVSLLNNDQLIAKSSVSLPEDSHAIFSVNSSEIIDGTILIEDPHLQFDNSLYFNINEASKINVMSINAVEHEFLSKIYTANEFNYTALSIDQLNYNNIDQQNLIILNELKTIPNSLSTALKAFTNNGGFVAIIPALETSINNYNTLLSNFSIKVNNNIKAEKRITSINYSHPIYQNVFDKKVSNFQYPKVNSYFNLSSNTSPLLLFEDSKPFLVQGQNVFLFASAINLKNSNFKNSPLIVPTLYNIGKHSLKTSNLYYTIGNSNTFDIAVKLQQNDILSLHKEDINIIPQQRYFNNKIAVTTTDLPTKAHIYTIQNKAQKLENISYNYNREESHLVYQDLTSLKHINTYSSINELFDTLKSDSKINALWKWFVIFALVLLIIEMLILKYFK